MENITLKLTTLEDYINPQNYENSINYAMDETATEHFPENYNLYIDHKNIDNEESILTYATITKDEAEKIATHFTTQKNNPTKLTIIDSTTGGLLSETIITQQKLHTYATQKNTNEFMVELTKILMETNNSEIGA